MDQEKKANRKYKDSLFTALFSESVNAIELYNAIEGKKYPLDTKIEINTLDDVLFLERVNDVSFILDNKLVVLIEQQSSINQNMPLRFLLYASEIYERIIAVNELNIYKRTLTEIPRPEFICLYNGKDYYPSQEVLRLSDAFMKVDDFEQIDLELKVKVVNINIGKNDHLLKESKALSDYVYFTNRIQINIDNGLCLKDAIKESVEHCISNGVLGNFLNRYRSEVIGMLTREFNMDLALRAAKYDGIVEGREEGREEGVELKERDFTFEMLKQNFPDKDILSLVKITAEKLEHYKQLLLVSK